ncbi:MAG: hypothetical protein V4543_04545 [Bacteroidota bacterium]
MKTTSKIAFALLLAAVCVLTLQVNLNAGPMKSVKSKIRQHAASIKQGRIKNARKHNVLWPGSVGPASLPGVENANLQSN